MSKLARKQGRISISSQGACEVLIWLSSGLAILVELSKNVISINQLLSVEEL